MKIVLASRNKGKIAELQTILREYFTDIEILSLDDVGLTGDIEETGKTFAENAAIKARAAAASGYIGVGDDSGLEVEALHGEPGVFSARYAGEHGDNEANMAKLLANLQGVKNRRAAFVSHVTCVFPNGETLDAEGRVEGEILGAKRGERGFGYDPLFYYPPLGKTFAELDAEEKNGISHRRLALAALAKKLKDRTGKRIL